MITLTVKKPPFEPNNRITIATETNQTGVSKDVHTLDELHSELDKFFSAFREDAVRFFKTQEFQSRNKFKESNTHKIQEELGLQPKIHNRFPSQELNASEIVSGKEAIEDTQIESTEWISIRKDELAQLISDEAAMRQAFKVLRYDLEQYQKNTLQQLSKLD